MRGRFVGELLSGFKDVRRLKLFIGLFGGVLEFEVLRRQLRSYGNLLWA